MADIRTVGEFDLTGPAEYPMRVGGKWGPVDSTWAENEKGNNDHSFGAGNLAYPYDTGNGLFWSLNMEGVYSGDVEAWGIHVGGGLGVAGEGWRIGFWDALSLGGGGTARGYVAMVFHALGDVVAIRKYTNATTWTYLATTGSFSDPYLLFRIRGPDLEFWSGDGTATTWTLRLSASDPDYRNNLMIGFASEDPTHGGVGWEYPGGGQRKRQFMYRWVKSN